MQERIGSQQLESIERAVDRLENQMSSEVFDPEQFREALREAEAATGTRLRGFRKSELREYAESIGVAVLVAMSLRAVVIEAFKIPSGSMRPTLQVGDHIFVTKFTYGPMLPTGRVLTEMPPDRGDIIVFEYPDLDLNNDRQDFIKRVIAIPGDTLSTKGGHPSLNGWRVPNCAVGEYDYQGDDGSRGGTGELFMEFLGESTYLTLYDHERQNDAVQGPYEVPPGEVWVMGDNRHNSKDSREWDNSHGTKGAGVPFENIKGRAWRVWFPTNRMFVDVMGRPILPDGVAPELMEGVERCLAERPPLEATLPPRGHSGAQ